jgi:capsid protein
MTIASLGTFYVGQNGVSEADGRDAHQLGARVAYDAIEERGRRASPAIRTQSEDRILQPTQRAKLDANAQDIHRNFAVAQWMIRRHLDYVATFQFHGRTEAKGLSPEENEAFNDQLEQWFARWSKPYNCDAAGRHRFSKVIRLTELQAILRGDCGLLKLANGSLQGIESDRIRNPLGTDNVTPDWVHGVKIDAAGRAKAYAIHKRQIWGAYQLDRVVGAQNLILHGYYDRFDQIRGISPIVTALNPFRDVYENFDLALAKAKVEQLFALVMTRSALDAAGDVATDSETGSGERSKTTVDFGQGPVVLDLDVGEDAKFLNGTTPSSNLQAFTCLVLTVGLKALDIPFSFFDESHTNFFGSRGAWLHYERACTDKREALVEIQNRILIWRLLLAILDGELVLPRGTTLGDIAWEFTPVGMPWWKPSEEIRGDLMAIAGGLDNPQRICKERGRGDFKDNVRQTVKAIKFAQQAAKDAEVDFRVSFDPGPEAPLQVVAAEELQSGK